MASCKVISRIIRWRLNIRRCTRVHLGILLFILVPFTYFQLSFPVRYLFRHSNVGGACIIPRPNPFDTSIMKYVWTPKPLVCDGPPPVVYVDYDGTVQFNKTTLGRIHLSPTDIQCQYKILKRHIDDDHVILTNATSFTPPCYVNADFFNIVCKKAQTGDVLVDKLFTGIRKLSDKLVDKESRQQLSVLLFGLDSVSRSAAIRKMPKTFNYLMNELGAHDFKGYMKVGENTLPNLVPVLTGRRVWTKEVPISDYATENFDTFPFAWRNFSSRDYATFYAEDMPEIGTFNYLTKGFTHPPVDHYMRPFWLGTKQRDVVNDKLSPVFLFLENQSVKLQKSSVLCYDDKPKHKVQIEYLKQYFSVYRNQRKFAFSFLTELTHEYPNFLAHGDSDFLEFLQWLKSNDHLKNMVLVFFSDHGARIDKIRNTFVGRIEDRMPLLHIVLPDHVKEAYPDLQTNLNTNTERLTTPFDLHQTLMDVLNQNFKTPTKSYISGSLRGLSLFQAVPESRSCTDAWVPEHYCACYTATSVNISSSPVVRKLAMKMVEDLNHLLTAQPKCAQLSLHEIREVQYISQGLKHVDTENKGISLLQFFTPEEKAEERYFLVIETMPGGGIFEGTYTVHPRSGMSMIGTIIRTNKYGDQPNCIQDKLMRPLCYCRDNIN